MHRIIRYCWPLLLLPTLFAQPAERPFFTDPSISPNRAEIAFVSGGDIWVAPLAGGEAHLLVSHPASESRPIYSPDGTRLAFISTRTGNGDIYVLTLATGAIKRITFDDVADALDAWSRDGKWLYFSSSAQDIGGMQDIYRVSAEGGVAMPVTNDRYVTEFHAAPSPDGNSLAFTARGNTFGQWWRHGHSHIDESEIWLTSLNGDPKYQRIAGGDFKCLWPMWSADGSRVYYMSDQGGAENLWERPVRGGAAKQVTQFKDGRLLWPSISYDGKTIVFERNFGIWKLDVASGKSAPIEITRRGGLTMPEVNHLSMTSGFRDLVVSPDAKKLAFVAHGQVFAASAHDNGPGIRVTYAISNESDLVWATDSKRLVYVSDRDGPYHLYQYDFTANSETKLTDGAGGDTAPQWSNDGKLLSFVRDGKQICVYDPAAKQTRVVVPKGRFPRPPFGSNRFYTWSPDDKWIAYSDVGEYGFRNVFVVPAAGGEPKQISFLSNHNSGTVKWAPDGTFILFDTNQRTEDNHIAAIALTLQPPHFREDKFRDLFKEAPAAGKSSTPEKKPAKPVEIVFEGIRNRLAFLPVTGDPRLQQITTDPNRIWYTSRGNVASISRDEATESVTIIGWTTDGTPKSSVQVSSDGKELFYLEQGRITIFTLSNRDKRTLSITCDIDVDFEREKTEVLAQAWQYLNDNFFDVKFHGVDWKAMRERFTPLVAGAHTSDELRRLLLLMIGELNASHMGIGSGGGNDASVGKIGLRFDPAEYAASGKLKVKQVIPFGPAALAGGIKTGDVLMSVNSTPTAAHTNLDELLDHKTGMRVALGFADGDKKREVAVRPISTSAEKKLVYRHWVEQQREYVAKVSGGRLGYVHIIDMSQEALDQLYLDLDTENQGREGVVVDIRNNNGGFVNGYALDVLARRSYLNMADRGEQAFGSRLVLGQRALERPTILVVNRHSLSDAEDFTEGYRALKLGKVVGEPTAGWIIYTSGTQLIDGTTLRLPGTRITTMSGADMEMNPRPVDIAVDKPVGEGLAGKDSQLDAAVKELLKQITPPTSSTRGPQ
jgi:Tol biopolymer transport system component/C-terminal processing protease CtpA/Prc